MLNEATNGTSTQPSVSVVILFRSRIFSVSFKQKRVFVLHKKKKKKKMARAKPKPRSVLSSLLRRLENPIAEDRRTETWPASTERIVQPTTCAHISSSSFFFHYSFSFSSLVFFALSVDRTTIVLLRHRVFLFFYFRQFPLNR